MTITEEKVFADDVDRKEITGRTAYEEVIDIFYNGKAPEHTFAKEQKDSCDIYFPTLNEIDEMKLRNITTWKYILTDYILERSKKTGMDLHFAKAEHYTNVFNDGFSLRWDISGRYDNDEEWEATSRTAGGQYGKEKRNKKFIKLKFDDADVVYKGRLLTPDEKERAKNYLIQKKIDFDESNKDTERKKQDMLWEMARQLNRKMEQEQQEQRSR